MDDAGRVAAGIGAAAMLVLAISGAMMLAARLGGWTAILRPIRGTTIAAVACRARTFRGLGLMLSALTGCYMSLATFGVLPDGMASPALPTERERRPARAAVGQLGGAQGRRSRRTCAN